MKIITLLNEKGGVGKTTLATHIAAGLAIRGSRVLVIDADPQGHATKILGLAKAPGLYNLLVRDADWGTVSRSVSPDLYELPGETNSGLLAVVPGNVETRAIPNLIDETSRFAERLEEIRDDMDYVIVDTSPTPSLLHGMLYIASDSIVYPTTLDALSFDGLIESIKRRQQANSERTRFGRPELHIGAIIPTMAQLRTVEHHDNLAELRQQFPGLVADPIRMSTIWREAAKAPCMVWTLDPSSIAAHDALSIVTRIEKTYA